MTNEHLWWPILKLFTWEPRLILPSCHTGAVCPMCVDLAYGSGGSRSPTREGVESWKWCTIWPFCFIFALKQYPLTDLRWSQGLSFWKSLFCLRFFLNYYKGPAHMKASSPAAMCGFSPIFQIPAVEIAVRDVGKSRSREELGQAQQLLRCARRMVGPAASLQLHRMPVANAPVVATSSCAQALLGKWW